MPHVQYEGGVLEMFLTESQKHYYTAMKKLGRKKPQKVEVVCEVLCKLCEKRAREKKSFLFSLHTTLYIIAFRQIYHLNCLS
jgi:hypothetical protein